ncbi:hypothetical protein CLF_105656 [Clonorchis sinensis]|uniref:Uncharacterized protein n=1 Tax=Clonorchis sinensis TaxID=79923 RepID=G7YDX2_CLOSI|nr:hypothetical protein CLF_105656 [Clonorchis sinensis]
MALVPRRTTAAERQEQNRSGILGRRPRSCVSIRESVKVKISTPPCSDVRATKMNVGILLRPCIWLPLCRSVTTKAATATQLDAIQKAFVAKIQEYNQKSNCHATRRKHEGPDTTKMPKPRREHSSYRDWVRTTDLLARSPSRETSMVGTTGLSGNGFHTSLPRHHLTFPGSFLLFAKRTLWESRSTGIRNTTKRRNLYHSWYGVSLLFVWLLPLGLSYDCTLWNEVLVIVARGTIAEPKLDHCAKVAALGRAVNNLETTVLVLCRRCYGMWPLVEVILPVLVQVGRMFEGVDTSGPYSLSKRIDVVLRQLGNDVLTVVTAGDIDDGGSQEDPLTVAPQ